MAPPTTPRTPPIPAPRGLVVDLPELRGRTGVFADRPEAARMLGEALDFCRRLRGTVVAATPQASELACLLAERLGFAVKTIPLAVSPAPLGSRARPHRRRGPLAATVRRRRGTAPVLGPEALAVGAAAELVILVDEGLTRPDALAARIRALRAGGAARVLVTAPTGSWEAAERAATEADVVLCANLRTARRCGIADAYRQAPYALPAAPPSLPRPLHA